MENASSTKVVTQGSLAEFDIITVISSLSLGRQYFRLDVHDGDSRSLGYIGVRGGQLVEAARGNRTGRDAFRALCRAAPPDGSFIVSRDKQPPESTKSLGPLDSLLIDLVAEQDRKRREEASSSPSSEPAQSERNGPAQLSPPVLSTASTSAPAAPVGLAIAVVSPKGGVGKTTTSLNLAAALAGGGRRVILIDGSVNGDVLDALAEAPRPSGGLSDVLAGEATIERVWIRSAHFPHLHVIPAFGMPRPPSGNGHDDGAAWKAVVTRARQLAELVIIDTPAGLGGVTTSILRAATHLVGVLQAEPLAARVSDRFGEAIAALPPGERPASLGVLINMLDSSSAASTGVLAALPATMRSLLFQCHIPRSLSILDASRDGQPLQFAGEVSLGHLYKAIATELTQRLKLGRIEGGRPRFLVP
jgi:chromosome partitioning protein